MLNLYLASSSLTRQQLLKDADFSFELLSTNLQHEEPFNPEKSLKENVSTAALFKAVATELPSLFSTEEKTIFVISADTLIAEQQGNILKKPKNLAEGHEQLKKLRAGPCVIGTAFIVQKFKRSSHTWILAQQIQKYNESVAEFYVPENEVDSYFEQMPYSLHACGSGIIEGYGAQFLKSFSGSYSGALGLPVFEVKETLIELGYIKT
ncbi:hypothetical protein FJ366_01755 [Candidatus Dependentiae bacterium]|nr:hypothetical protein [Candidatus Dependentiae bacterium]